MAVTGVATVIMTVTAAVAIDTAAATVAPAVAEVANVSILSVPVVAAVSPLYRGP